MDKENNWKQRFVNQKCGVIIPTYNNASSILQVIEEVKEYCDDVFVVNDGSTDDTAVLLNSCTDIEVIEYAQNKGKGYALQQGFKAAYERGFDYAITIDSDGQHYASDLVKFLSSLEAKKNDILEDKTADSKDMHVPFFLIGSRDLVNKGQKKASKFANKFADFWLKLETGTHLEDTQSGYRLYPLEHMVKTKWYCTKYEFELEVLVRSIWKGIQIEEIGIDVYYAPMGERVSHFRPFWDFLRMSVLNMVLVLLGLLYYRPALEYRKFKKKGLKQLINDELDKKENSNSMLALSIGFGFFMGVFPIWGYQLLVGLTVAYLLRLNKVLFFISANISLPPLIPFILYGSVAIGAFLMGEKVELFAADITWDFLRQNLIQYLVGAVTLSFVLGSIGTAVFYVLFKKFRK